MTVVTALAARAEGTGRRRTWSDSGDHPRPARCRRGPPNPPFV